MSTVNVTGSATFNGIRLTLTVPLVLNTVTPPPASHLQVGTSPGGSGAANLDAALKDFPAAEVVRVFLGAGLPVPVAGNAIFADAVRRGLEVWVSWNTMPTDAQWIAVLKDWMASGATIWWDYRHEVDAPKEAAAQFRSEYDHLQAVAESVPGYSASKVRDQFILMAYVLDPSQPHGVPSSWYPTRPTRGGYDVYNKAALARVVAEAKRLKMRYVFPEIGCGGANSEAKGDPAGAQWLKDAAASWASYPPEGLCFFASNSGNGIGVPLAGMPLMVAELTALAKT